MQILLASPRGFCAGVKRAISIVKSVLEVYGAPIYVLHEIVHNKYVVNSLSQKGVIFVEQISEIPNGTIVIFSAHGVSQKIRNEAKNRDLMIFDATCPLVSKVHMRVSRASKKGEESILIGHAGHPEVEGTIGQYLNPKGGIYLVESINDVSKLKVKNKDCLSFMTQTTLSVDDTSEIINMLRQRFPKVIGPHKNDICYATINRQKAVRKMADQADLILVVGSKNSSNANRLVELAKKLGKTSFLIEDKMDIQEDWIKTVKCVGITASASSPDTLIQDIIPYLKRLGGNKIVALEVCKENLNFRIPKSYILQYKYNPIMFT